MEVTGRPPNTPTCAALAAILGPNRQNHKANKESLSRAYRTMYRRGHADAIIPLFASLLHEMPQAMRAPVYRCLSRLDVPSLAAEAPLGKCLRELPAVARAKFIEHIEPLIGWVTCEELVTLAPLSSADDRWTCIYQIAAGNNTLRSCLPAWVAAWGALPSLVERNRFTAHVNATFKGHESPESLAALVLLPAAVRQHVAVRAEAINGPLPLEGLAGAAEFDNERWAAYRTACNTLGRHATDHEVHCIATIFAAASELQRTRLSAAIRRLPAQQIHGAIEGLVQSLPQASASAMVCALRSNPGSTRAACAAWGVALQRLSDSDTGRIETILHSISSAICLEDLALALTRRSATRRVELVELLRADDTLAFIAPLVDAEPTTLMPLLEDVTTLSPPLTPAARQELQKLDPIGRRAVAGMLRQTKQTLDWSDACSAIDAVALAPSHDRVWLVELGNRCAAITPKSVTLADCIRFLRPASPAARTTLLRQLPRVETSVKDLQWWLWCNEPSVDPIDAPQHLGHRDWDAWQLYNQRVDWLARHSVSHLLPKIAGGLYSFPDAAAARGAIDHAISYLSERHLVGQARDVRLFALLMQRRGPNDVDAAHTLMPDGHVSALASAARLWDGHGPLPSYVVNFARQRGQESLNGLLCILEQLQLPADLAENFRLAVLDVATAAAAPQVPRRTTASFECAACREPRAADDAFALAHCSCEAPVPCCRACTRNAVEGYARQTCLTGCGAPITRQDLECMGIAPGDVAARLKPMVAARLHALPHWKWCATPDCFSGRQQQTPAAVACGICNTETVTGNDRLVIGQLLSGIGASSTPEGTGLSRECYSCAAATEKTGGCLHMTCPQCHANWDFVSGEYNGTVFAHEGVRQQAFRPLRDGVLANAGFYEGIPYGTLDAEHQAILAARAKLWLERYPESATPAVEQAN